MSGAGRRPLSLFQATGIELEYMIVDRETLDVRPLADELLRQVAGGYEMEVERGPVAWSNELVLHVVEMKTNGPAPTLHGVAPCFQQSVGEIDALLAPLGARLMPTGMHPWMDPAREMRLWSHEDRTIYQTFDRIFDCRGHGWANLQSTHINLPFRGAREFGRLHAAIRLVLPILPALAASSPFLEARRTSFLDTRLEVYRHNADRVPAVGGEVVPEPFFTPRAYERGILQPIYAALAPLDPSGVLRYEWVNARGAIARFDRDAIEIRVLDIQECPAADLAVVAAVVGAVRALVEERLSPSSEQTAWPVAPLASIFRATLAEGDRTPLTDTAYLRALGLRGRERCTAGELWRHLVEQGIAADGGPPPECAAALDTLLEHGCLARRILAAVGAPVTRARLHAVYGALCDCLAEGRLFLPERA